MLDAYLAFVLTSIWLYLVGPLGFSSRRCFSFTENSTPPCTEWLISISVGLTANFFCCRRAVRMGQHCWLLLATVITEILVITKWSKGQFPEPLPTRVKWGWTIGATLLVLYPIVQVRSFSTVILPGPVASLELELSPSLALEGCF